MKIQLLWFEGCPNHQHAERLVRSVLAQEGVEAGIERIEVEDEEAGNALCFRARQRFALMAETWNPDGRL